MVFNILKQVIPLDFIRIKIIAAFNKSINCWYAIQQVVVDTISLQFYVGSKCVLCIVNIMFQ